MYIKYEVRYAAARPPPTPSRDQSLPSTGDPAGRTGRHAAESFHNFNRCSSTILIIGPRGLGPQLDKGKVDQAGRDPRLFSLIDSDRLSRLRWDEHMFKGKTAPPTALWD